MKKSLFYYLQTFNMAAKNSNYLIFYILFSLPGSNLGIFFYPYYSEITGCVQRWIFSHSSCLVLDRIFHLKIHYFSPIQEIFFFFFFFLILSFPYFLISAFKAPYFWMWKLCDMLSKPLKFCLKFFQIFCFIYAHSFSS